MSKNNTQTTSITIDEYDATLGYHRSVLPLDIRLGITSNTSSQEQPQQPLRWGILATGKVAHDFAQVLKVLPHHTIAAVGSRTIERAQWFAHRHNIPTAHGSYEDLCHDLNVDIIYVASLHPDHKEHAIMALNGGKHVLVEKPMAMKAKDAQLLYDLGKEKGLFVGEGMWTRFFPAVEWTRCCFDVDEKKMMSCVQPNNNNNTNKIGQVRVIQADFSIDGQDVGQYPSDSIYAKELGGGSAWTLLPYIIGASLLPFGGREPDRIAATGIIPDDENDVGDVAIGMTMTFTIEDNEQSRIDDGQPPPRNRAIASGVVGYLAESSEVTMYAGKTGRIIVNAPAHCPTSVTLIRKPIGIRGNGATSNNDNDNGCDADSSSTIQVEFPLPQPTKEVEDTGGIQLPNSMGFVYEAEAVRRLISAKYYTFPQWTPEESVACIRTIEETLNQVGR